MCCQVNHIAAKTLGYSREQVVGRRMRRDLNVCCTDLLVRILKVYPYDTHQAKFE